MLALGRDGRASALTAVHEAVHCGVPHAEPAHGPLFVAAAALAYARHFGFAAEDALALAAAEGVAAAPTELVAFAADAGPRP